MTVYWEHKCCTHAAEYKKKNKTKKRQAWVGSFEIINEVIVLSLVCLLNSLWDILESEIDVAKVREKTRERVEKWLTTLVDGKMADDGG